jgi:serine protease DegS
VIENAQEIEISTNDGRQFQAFVVGVDPDTDLAVLKINADNLLSISLGNSNTLRIGDVVLAIGNPYGLGQTVSQGIISATGRNQLGINVFENYIQTDASIHPGNSGGALINARGELIGINTITSLDSGSSIGIGFAIPSLLAQEMMSDMITHGRVLRGWMGVRVQSITPQLSQSFSLGVSKGVIITNVIRNSPAHLAGLTLGDVITHINNESVFHERQILNQVIAYRPGETITLQGLRRAQEVEWEITVGQRPIYGTSY